MNNRLTNICSCNDHAAGKRDSGFIITELLIGGLLLLCLSFVVMKVLLLFFGMAFGLVSTFLGLLVYFLPSMLAWGKSRFTTIFLVNLIFGGTVIGWIVALIWAMGAEKRPAQIEAAE